MISMLYNSKYTATQIQSSERPVDALEHFKDRPLLFEPGTQYRYSNYGWILVSAAVEDATNEPFLSFMRKRIFEPLGMDDTQADSATEAIPDRATFYFPRFAANPHYGPDLMRPLDYSCYAGSRFFLSTPSDLVRFALAINSGRLLEPATVQLLQTSLRLPTGEETEDGPRTKAAGPSTDSLHRSRNRSKRGLAT